MGEDKEEVDYLYLIMMPFAPEWQNNVNPADFKYALLTYLATWDGVDTKKNQTVLRMKADLDRLTMEKKNIMLMNYFDLKIPREVLNACASIDWKLRDSIKN